VTDDREDSDVRVPAGIASPVPKKPSAAHRQGISYAVKFFTENAPRIGDADLVSLGPDRSRSIALSFVAALLMGQGAEGAFALPSVTVFCLPNEQPDLLFDRTQAIVAEVGPPSAEMDFELRRRLTIRSLPAMETSDLVSAIADVPSGSAVVVLDAQAYASPLDGEGDLRSAVETGGRAKTPRIVDYEAFWVDRVYHVGLALASVARDHGSYVLCLAGEYRPVQTEHHTRLLEPFSAVLTGDFEGRSAPPPASQVQRWRDAVIAGDTAGPFAEIDRTFGEKEWAASVVKATILYQCERSPEAYQMVRDLIDSAGANRSPLDLLMLARIAVKAGHDADAARLLQSCLNAQPHTEHSLAGLASTASRLGDDNLADAARQLLRQHFPHTPESLRLETRALLKARRYADAASLLEGIGDRVRTDPELSFSLLQAQSMRVETPELPEFIALVAELLPDFRDRALEQAVTYAVESGNLSQAIDLLPYPVDTNHWGALFDLGLAILSSSVEVPTDAVEPAHAAATLDYCLDYLAWNPWDASRRARLANALSTERVGFHGHALLLGTLPTTAPEHLVAEAAPDSTDTNIEGWFDIIRRYWPPRRDQVALLVPEPFPRELQPEDPLPLIRGADVLLTHMGMYNMSADRDTRGLGILLKPAIDLAESVEPVLGPLRLVRTAALALTLAGDFQGGRDHAEHLLRSLSKGTTASITRFAWMAFSDVYLRCRNVPEALLGYACAARLPTTPEPANEVAAYHLLLARLWRELGVAEAARSLAQAAQNVLSSAGLSSAAAEARHQYFLASVLMRTDSEGSPEVLAEISSHICRAIDICPDTSDLMPPLILAAQLLQQFSDLGLSAPTDLKRAFDEGLPRIGEPGAQRLRMLANPTPTLEDVAAFGWAAPLTRYATDLATDLSFIDTLLHRCLGTYAAAGDAASALIVIELMSDIGTGHQPDTNLRDAPQASDTIYEWAQSRLATSRLGGSEREALIDIVTEHPRSSSAIVDAVIRSPSEATRDVLSFARTLVDLGAEVHGFGLISTLQLVGVSVSSTGDADISIDTAFDVEALARWSQHYPSAYSDHDVDVVAGREWLEATLRGVAPSIPQIHGGTQIVVRSRKLATVPFQLYRVGSEFLGMVAPSAEVPSLTWLKQRLSAPDHARDRGLLAWVLPADDE
jgi:tetratricopeptide (TPR) repeat protein